MTDRLSGVVLLPTDGSPAGPPVDLSIRDGRIAQITAAADPPTRRLLAMPALVNAHDHARPLSPTSFGAAGKPLETWLLRLAAMPAIDPYLGAVAAFGRAARAGAGSVMAHYTRFHGPMAPIDEAKEIARAARDVGLRVTLAVFMRDRNPLVYEGEDSVLMKLPDDIRAVIETQFLSSMPGVVEQIANVEAIAAETESALFSVQFGPSGPQWCSDALIAAIGEASRADRPARAYAFARDPISARVRRPRLSGRRRRAPEDAWAAHAAPDARPLRPRPARRTRRDRGRGRDHRHQSKLESSPQERHCANLRGAPSRGCRVALGVDASAFDEDDDIVREMRLGHFLHGGWGFDSVIERGAWLSAIVANGRFANGAPGPGALSVGAPADILVLDLDALDRDAVMAVEPIDLVFARASAAHVARLMVAGREIVRDGRVTGVDLDAAEGALRRHYREKMPSRAAFLEAWRDLEPAVAAHYRDGLGCC